MSRPRRSASASPHPAAPVMAWPMLALLCGALLAGCAALPPGSDAPKPVSVALANPGETRLGRQFDSAASQHGGDSGFRILSVGLDGLLTRMQMIDAAERTLDLQYYIFRGDEAGRRIADALLRAADRGVRVRVLVDDGSTVEGDEQILALDGHAGVEIRVFNPFSYRGHNDARRAVEFAFNKARLDYRMHNKLIVADNSVALIGGRNIGNEYFQIDPDGQFADDDVFAAGPVARKLSATFDDYWNSRLAIPASAIARGQASRAALAERRTSASPPLAAVGPGETDIEARIASGEPYAGMLSGRLPLVWAKSEVICDRPEDKWDGQRSRPGRIIAERVAAAAAGVQTELLMVTPYFVPADDELAVLKELRERSVRVRILTNSLESSDAVAAQSGYRRYRVPLLRKGVELNEIRSRLGNTRGSGQSQALSRFGTYSLHAKLFVFDRRRLFVGSLNFDRRSKYLNTEIGLIIDSPELAAQAAARFEAMVQPENSYRLALVPAPDGGAPRLVWRTREDGRDVEYSSEPAKNAWQRLKVRLMSLLPLDGEL